MTHLKHGIDEMRRKVALNIETILLLLEENNKLSRAIGEAEMAVYRNTLGTSIETIQQEFKGKHKHDYKKNS